VPFALDGAAAIHIYRVLQEALNNVARHSGAREAQVRLQFSAEGLDLEVEDHGKGGVAVAARSGIGLVAMRERAELLRGTIEFTQPPQGGTLVRMRVPREGNEANVG
jgi:two-component system sensor histidine kinase UhpB